MIGLGWLAYVRTDYRDSANNESHSGTLRVARSRRVRYPILPNQNDFSSPCSLLESPLPMTYVTLRYHNDGIFFLLEVSKFNIVQPRVLLNKAFGQKSKCVTAYQFGNE